MFAEILAHSKEKSRVKTRDFVYSLMILSLRKVSYSEQQQKEQFIQKINCSECDSFQLYQAAGL